jgi:hypothetical protein
MAALRADLVFSYWIYLWYILYAFKITNFSPKFPLILGLIDNIIMLLLMLVVMPRLDLPVIRLALVLTPAQIVEVAQLLLVIMLPTRLRVVPL